jgi:hypothetical protein
MHKLQSIAIWVDEKTKTLYPCDKNGNIYKKNGISLDDLSQNWYNYLDIEDKLYLLNLINKTN